MKTSFFLSDIPLSNVLRLGYGKISDKETYGANIIDILGSSFFLDSTIGEEVRLQLMHLSKIYHERSNPNLMKEYKRNKRYYKQLVSRLGDPYLKEMMIRMCKDLDKMVNINISEHV